MTRGTPLAGAAAAAVRVAEYVYGPQHAFVYHLLSESSVASFTTHGAARVLGSSRPALVRFILIDLEKIFLLRQTGPVFSLAPLLAVDQAIERVPDRHLLRAGGHGTSEGTGPGE
jgi:hypothetical protein